MTLKFTETAPGVHTTSLENPKTKQRHNIAVIESSDAWQLFMDGELAARDLPSFEEAVEKAQKKVAGGSSRLSGTSGLLVFGSLAGALVIGTSMLIVPAMTEPAENNAKSAALTAPASRFERVRPKNTPAHKAQSEGKRAANATFPAKTKPQALPVVTISQLKTLNAPGKSGASVTAARPVALTAVVTTAASAPDSRSEKADQPKSTVRRFSAENSVLGKGSQTTASSKPETKTAFSTVRPLEPAKLTAKVAVSSAQPLEPVVIQAAPEPEAPTSSPIVTATTEKAIEADDGATTASLTPPLPIVAPNLSRPVLSRPVIRPEFAVTERPKLNALFANLKENDDEVAAPRREKQSQETTKPKRSTKQAKRARDDEDDDYEEVRRSRRKYSRSRSERHERRRSNRYRTADSDRPSRSRHMVCFAHTCRFQ